jgi:hypothetical protein
MTADVSQDRRVTVPILGLHALFVDWSRLFWALLSLVHERSGYRVLAPDRIQGDAVLSVFNFTAQSRITSRHSSRDLDLFVPTILPRAVLAAVKAATRRLWRWPSAPHVCDCDAARRQDRGRDEETASVEQRN